VGGSEDFVNALRAIRTQKRAELGGPPTPAELLAYRDGELDAAARQVVEAKLAVYPEAARALADLAVFPDVEPAPGVPDLSDEEVEARWQIFRRRLEKAQRPRRVRVRWLAAAALLMLAVGFFAGQASRSPLPGQAINVTIAELTPLEEAREGGARALGPLPVIEMPAGSEEVVIVLGVLDDGDFPDYVAEVSGEKGDQVWSRAGLRPTPLGTFQLSFRRGVLPPGPYRIRLFGREADRKTLLATYELQLVEGPENS
jgi:hypothetical protein